MILQAMAGVLLMAVALGASGAEPISLSEIRHLVDRQRYPEALAGFNAQLRARPGDSDLLIEAARVNGWADKHGAAADLYRRVLVAAPQRRADVRLPLAWQLLWDGRAGEARPWFQESLQEGAAASRTEARHGLAEALEAEGKLAEALRINRQLLADDATDLRARKAEARLLLWLDRSQAASRRYQGLLAEYPGDHGFQLAQVRALRWAGMDDGALALLQRWALSDPATQALKAEILYDNASRISGSFELAQDSDALSVRAMGMTAALRAMEEGRFLALATRRVELAQQGYRGEGSAVTVRAGTRVGDTRAGLAWLAGTLGARDYGGWQTPAWQFDGKWIPRDEWRIDLEAGNEIVENRDALRNRVTATHLAAGVDWRGTPGWTSTLGVAVFRFDDGNTRTRVTGRVQHVWRHDQPRVEVGIVVMGMSATEPTVERGYYNPARYAEGKLLGQVEYRWRGWQFKGNATAGEASEMAGAGGLGIYSLEASAEKRLTSRTALQVRATQGSSYSLTGGGTGYSRKVLGVTLTRLL